MKKPSDYIMYEVFLEMSFTQEQINAGDVQKLSRKLVNPDFWPSAKIRRITPEMIEEPDYGDR